MGRILFFNIVEPNQNEVTYAGDKMALTNAGSLKKIKFNLT